ncbi:MAG TPA: urea carboxylase-associated family protein [Solirubrobacteraceae bacterium]|nr:urea carboxylase-associated family protein [Solirubrobacteraceae bacterium]
MPDSAVIVAPRRGRAVQVAAGARLEVVNREGGQVADMWALCAADPSEWLSMEHTRTALRRLVPAVGDELVSSSRRPLLRLVADSSPGVHDTLIAACDSERYRQLGAGPGHANCADNLRQALAAEGIQADRLPAPLNLFMNIPWQPDGRLEFLPSPARAGDRVTFEALVDVVIVVSACPMDLNPINGGRLGSIGLRLVA